MGNVYFKPGRSQIIYQALAYLKSHKKLYEDIAKGLSGEEMFKFSDILEIQGQKGECY